MRLVTIESLKPGMMTAQGIYLRTNKFIPLIREHSILTETMISELRYRGVNAAYILDRSEWPKTYFREELDTTHRIYVPRAKPLIDLKLREEALHSLEDIFAVAAQGAEDAITTSAQVIRHVDTVVEQLVASLEKEPGALVNINDLKSYDEYTFHHSLSVAVLSIAISQHLGFDKDTMTRLGTCAMMHDIGKTSVPIDIIHKPSKLDQNEFLIIKSHSPAGYDYLTKTAIKDDEILQGVLHHHEKFDGTGYPEGIKGYHIPLWSRIISVADVYDALTSKRPYRMPMQPAEAVEYIMGGVGSMFDFESVYAFVNKLELYPIGSKIELSSGRIAVIINNENQLRPVVRDIHNGEILDLHRDRRCLSVVIKRLIDDGANPANSQGPQMQLA